MQQFNVEFFTRNNLTFKHRDTAYDPIIDDDYISASTNTIEISATTKVDNGDFISLRSEDYSFFGFVSDVSPGEFITTITYKPFIAIFDEPFLFNTSYQGTGSKAHPSLESTISSYITSLYINPSDSDSYQKLPIRIAGVTSSTPRWSLNITPDTEDTTYSIIHLYSVLLVDAMKKYGVCVRPVPDFSEHIVNLYIETRPSNFKIDADLDNVTVKTLKYNDRPDGVNKLILYNTEDYSMSLTYYVHSDRTFDTDNVKRIYPVVRECQGISPDRDSEDPVEAFALSALDAAFSFLSGLNWDNLIELEVLLNDPVIKPMELKIGQTVTIYYKEGKYSSMLTGKHYSSNVVTLMFGSERIQYSKRRRER